MATWLVLLHRNRDALCPASVAVLVPGWRWAPVQGRLGAEAALAHSAPAPFSVPMANVPWLHRTRLCLGAPWASWPLSGGLSSAMGLTLSAVGWGTVYPLSSPNHFLLSLLVLFFFERVVLLSPLPPAMGPLALLAIGSPAEPDPGHHLPCWADRGAAQPLPCSSTTLHPVAIGTRATAVPNWLQAGQ